jgi:hypothetical protein
MSSEADDLVFGGGHACGLVWKMHQPDCLRLKVGRAKNIWWEKPSADLQYSIVQNNDSAKNQEQKLNV